MTTVTFDWTFSDPDAGDSQKAYELRYRRNGGAWVSTGKVVSTATARTISGLVSGNYDWQVLTWDQADAVGSWSAIRSFVINLPPTAPTNLTVSSTEVLAGDTVTIGWQHNDPEGDAQAKRQIRYKDIALTAWVTQAEVANLISDPSFENDTLFPIASGTTQSISTDWSAWGTKSLKVVSDGVTSDCYAGYSTNQAPLEAGKTYTISGTVYTPVAQSGVVHGRARKITVHTNDGTGWTEYSSNQGPVTGDGRVTLIVTIPSNATSILLRFYNGSPTSGEAVYWDDVVVVEGTESLEPGIIDTTGFGDATYEVQVRTADQYGYGPWSASIQFNTVTTIAADVYAVPGVGSLAVGAHGIGTGVNSVPPQPVIFVAVAPTFIVEQELHPPAAIATQVAPPPVNIGGAYTIHVISPVLQLDTAGEVTLYWNGLFAKPASILLDATPPSQTVYIMPTAPVYTEEQYRKRFIDPQTTITRRVEILEANGATLWDDKVGNLSRLISGNVSVDYDRDERRSLDLELANFDKALVHKPDGFWYDKIIQTWRGIEFYDQSGLRKYEVSLGKFMIDRVVQPRFPNTVRVTARDYTKKLLLSKFTAATGFAASQTIEDVIAAIAGAGGIDDRILPVTGKTLGVDTFFERGTARWEAMKQIATAHGYELFFDAYGYLVMRPFLDPTLSPVSHEFLTGPKVGNLVDWEKSANDTRIFNHISVIGADTETIPVWGDAYNNNPNSPTRIDLLGDRVFPIESPLVTTFAQAEELAQTYLKIYGLEEYEINMSSIVFPWLEAGEIVRFVEPDAAGDDPDRFLLTSFNVPMGLEPMSAVGRRVMIVS